MNRPPQRALILANPCARRGRQAVLRAVETLAKLARANGTECTTALTQRDGPREAELVRQHGDSVDVIYAIGGDGTVRACVLAMDEAQRQRLAIGFVPMGNANVLARTVGIDCRDEQRAIEQVLAGSTVAMDVGCLDGEPRFLMMMDCGYFARVVHTITAARSRPLTGWLYRHFGNVLYAGVGLRHLLPGRSAPVQMTVDGQEVATSACIGIANVPIYARTGSLCPAADPRDGLLDYNAMRGRSALRYSLAAMRARPSAKLSHIGQGQAFVLRASRRPFVCQVDGDPLAGGPFEQLAVAVHAGYYRLIVPGGALARAASG